MCCKRYHVIFSTFSLNFKCKICVQEEVIHNFKKSHFDHVTIYELRYFKKMVRVWKAKSLLFCLRYDPLIVHSKAKSYNFQFHKNDVTWRCQMAYSPTKQVPHQFCTGKPPRQNSLHKNVSAWTRKYARQWLNVQRAARFSLRWLNVGWIYITCKWAD